MKNNDSKKLRQCRHALEQIDRSLEKWRAIAGTNRELNQIQPLRNTIALILDATK